MTRENPIYTVSIECPVCKNANQFESIRVGAYTESDRDTDFCPTGRQWRNPEFQKVNPLVYSMAACKSCLYTRELDGNYKNWQRDVSFKMYKQKSLREAHLKAFAEPDGALRRLGTRLDLARFSNETGVNKLLLGILDELLQEPVDALNVARYFLRIAWLFREAGGPPAATNAHLATAHRVRDALTGNRARWNAWFEQTKGLLDAMRHEFPGENVGEGILVRIDGEVAALLAGWETMIGQIPDGVEPGESPAAYFEFASHREFLQNLRQRWDVVPLDEDDALAQALKYYRSYFENCRAFPSPEQEMQTSYLIAELARRTHQLQLASDYFNHAIRKGQQLVHEFRNDAQRVNYIRKLLEMSFEQGKKSRTQDAVEV
jgi:hypothetical protein